MSEQAEKPLHVRVAEALGWTKLKEHTQQEHDAWEAGRERRFGPCSCGWLPGSWNGLSPDPSVTMLSRLVPNWDTDWSATGPLIEKYGIDLNHFGDGNPKDCSDPMTWFARHERREHGKWDEVEAATPLLAVCELIVLLAQLGELIPWMKGS